ncbi:hypothetical protein B4Q04_02130 [Zobellia sp. OII3]|uniref:hypothetical protein n=1 Tax=Zobellia sp. OII3 TaxID=2034520 RepID=UPI000B531695|nr:hypothetical protein [Zobellia sp. OII3]OWW26506.1 hypothetical protein B4Q04_02130 [Zobellia sp. OII3]
MKFRFGYYGVYKEFNAVLHKNTEGWQVIFKNQNGIVQDMDISKKEAKNRIKSAYFVRAFNQHKIGRWLVSIEDIPNFNSVDDFINKTALPVVDEFGSIQKPDKLVLVKVPAGTTIRKSVARPQDWGGQGHLSGGATQFEIINFDWQYMGDWFKNMGNINQFINK